MAESTNSSGKAAEISGGWELQENGVGDGHEAESRGRGSKGLKEWEAGEIGGGGGGAKGRKARKKGARSRDARNGVREVWTPCPPPPPLLFRPGCAICLRDILG